MARLEMKATELTNTDVNFVSLVKRGANRIPFRITKGDEDMDLYAIGRRIFQKSDPVPTVVAVIAQKSDEKSAARMNAVARAVGFDKVKLGKADDGVATLTKADAEGNGGAKIVVKLDDRFAVALANSNLDRAMKNHDFSESIFKDADGRKGFFLGPAAATRAFNAFSTDVTKNAANPTEVAVQLGKAATDYRAYIDALAIGFPQAAFTADQLVKDYGDEDDWNDDENNGDDTGDDTGAGDGEDKSGKGDEDNRAKKQDDLMKTADAGKNGTGEGVEPGKGTGTTPAATDDDAANTEINAKPGEKVSGSNSGMPEKTMKRDELLKTAAELILKALTTDVTSKEITGESAAGEGAAQAVDHRDVVSDEGTVAPGTGKPKGKCLDMDGVPAGVRAKKNDGDAAAKGKALPDDEFGAGAKTENVQTFKAEDVMRAVSALAKSVEASNAAVTKTVTDLAARVEGVAALARKTDAALNGTVFNDAGEDRALARKSEGTGDIPLLDTAYSRRTA